MRRTKIFTLVLMIVNTALLGVLIFALLGLLLNQEDAPAAGPAVQPAASSAPEAMGAAGDEQQDRQHQQHDGHDALAAFAAGALRAGDVILLRGLLFQQLGFFLRMLFVLLSHA